MDKIKRDNLSPPKINVPLFSPAGTVKNECEIFLEKVEKGIIKVLPWPDDDNSCDHMFCAFGCGKV